MCWHKMWLQSQSTDCLTAWPKLIWQHYKRVNPRKKVYLYPCLLLFSVQFWKARWYFCRLEFPQYWPVPFSPGALHVCWICHPSVVASTFSSVYPSTWGKHWQGGKITILCFYSPGATGSDLCRTARMWPLQLFILLLKAERKTS